MHQGPFADLKKLQFLDLRNQSFNSLPVGMFTGLGTSTDRVELSIDGIRTSYVGRCYWHCSLYLANMNLTELPTGVFDGLEHRDLFLSLQGNKLRTLPAGLFRNLSNLSELHLQGNGLRTLPEGLFRNLSSLRYLYLQNNGLEELPSSVWAKPC